MQDRQEELIGLIGWLQSEPLRKAQNVRQKT